MQGHGGIGLARGEEFLHDPVAVGFAIALYDLEPGICLGADQNDLEPGLLLLCHLGPPDQFLHPQLAAQGGEDDGDGAAKGTCL